MEKHLSSRTPKDQAALLLPEINIIKSPLKHIHLMGICGTGMASLAGLLNSKGFQITGSDQNIYPPMSDFLESLHIPVLTGYRAENLHPFPDLVIVGNVITRQNPEAVELARLKLPYLSLPQALGHFALEGKRSIVISGTHGKTTTSSLVSWILEKAGLDPGFMIGGIPLNFQQNFKAGHGPYFVIEGDEYDTAFFDKGPKFLHYRPWIVILTSIEFDHADIYRNLEHVLASFRKLIDLIPATGLLIANTDDARIRDELDRAKCPVWTYGLSGKPLWRVEDISSQKARTRLTVSKEGQHFLTLETGLYGRHNISNLLSAVALTHFLGIVPHAISDALNSFRGIKRRQEILGEPRGVLLIDDFAHHPTAVRETVHAVKERFPGRSLVAVFEPRSNSSRRKIFQERYAESFNLADRVLVPEPPLMKKVPEGERFSSRCLVSDLKKQGIRASYFKTTDALLKGLLDDTHAGDVVLFMSNGGFDNLPKRFLHALKNRS
ncbi:MAG: UDP-N-acetylmuramate--L-alanine ligase [Deltaproteobacteria bacterium]|nr:UDP-N-acetylmuramate--L-alanine ligase [Deltaproteobacteria bacterium]